MKKNKKIYSIGFIFIASALLSLVISTIITSHVWESASFKDAMIDMRKQVMINRAIVIWPVFFFCGLHFIVDIKSI